MQNRGHINSAHSANTINSAVADFEVQIHVEAPDRGETTVCGTDESVTADFSIFSVRLYVPFAGMCPGSHDDADAAISLSRMPPRPT